MTQALGELRGPVTQDALRLRMAALHGRDDALLDPARFPRLLRQANDAEIADVRKVGEDDYEISPRRVAGMAAPAPSTPAASGPATAPAEPIEQAPPSTPSPVPVSEPAAGVRENGQRFGVRFRRGSRGGLRSGEIPLIGLVEMEVPAETAITQAAPNEAAQAAPEETGRKTARPRRSRKPAPSRSEGKGKTAAAKAEKPAKAELSAADSGDAPAAAKRGRSRARKKAE
jgi:hypothetical protein